MTTTPTPSTTATQADIDDLARQIAIDGTLAHHGELGRLADLVEQAALLPGSVSVLRDIEAAEVIRARAFLLVARRWDDVLAAHGVQFDRSFAALATHWTAHQQLRSKGNIEQLARSSQRLDTLRSQARARVPSSR